MWRGGGWVIYMLLKQQADRCFINPRGDSSCYWVFVQPGNVVKYCERCGEERPPEAAPQTVHSFMGWGAVVSMTAPQFGPPPPGRPWEPTTAPAFFPRQNLHNMRSSTSSRPPEEVEPPRALPVHDPCVGGPLPLMVTRVGEDLPPPLSSTPVAFVFIRFT